MGYVDGTLADPCVCYDSHSHVNKSKGTHQLVVGGIIASATKEEGKKQSLSLSLQRQENTKEMESWCICPPIALFWVLNHSVH